MPRRARLRLATGLATAAVAAGLLAAPPAAADAATASRAAHRRPLRFAALIADDEIVDVHPDGTRTAVLTRADGLANPTSLAVHDGTVYVDSAAYFTHKDPNLLLACLGGLLGH